MALALAFLMVLELVPGLLPYEEGNIVYADEAGSTGAVRPALVPHEGEAEQESSFVPTVDHLLPELRGQSGDNASALPQKGNQEIHNEQNVRERDAKQPIEVKDIRNEQKTTPRELFYHFLPTTTTIKTMDKTASAKSNLVDATKEKAPKPSFFPDTEILHFDKTEQNDLKLATPYVLKLGLAIAKDCTYDTFSWKDESKLLSSALTTQKDETVGQIFAPEDAKKEHPLATMMIKDDGFLLTLTKDGKDLVKEKGLLTSVFLANIDFPTAPEQKWSFLVTPGNSPEVAPSASPVESTETTTREQIEGAPQQSKEDRQIHLLDWPAQNIPLRVTPNLSFVFQNAYGEQRTMNADDTGNLYLFGLTEGDYFLSAKGQKALLQVRSGKLYYDGEEAGTEIRAKEWPMTGTEKTVGEEPKSASLKNSPKIVAKAPKKGPTVIDSGFLTGQYPIEIQYASRQYLKDVANTQVPDYTYAKVVWDITLQTKDVKNKNLDFNSLALSLYGSEHQYLSNYQVQIAETKEGLATAPATSFTDKVGVFKLFKTSLPKDQLWDTTYVRVTAVLDRTNPIGRYSLGVRLTSDVNYIAKAKQKFLDYYNSIPNLPPFIIKYIRGLDEAGTYDKGFNLLDMRLVADTTTMNYTQKSNFYMDKTRSVTGMFEGNNHINWEAIELLRLGDVCDPAMQDAAFANNYPATADDRLPNVSIYTPNADGSYTVKHKNKISATQLQSELADHVPGVLVVYDYQRESNTAFEDNTMTVDMQQKNDDENGSVGGRHTSLLRKITEQELQEGYHAYIPYPYSGQPTKIDKTFEWAYCFNKNKLFPQSMDFDKLGLTQNDVYNDAILNSAASEGRGRQAGVLTRMKKVFFYADQYREEFKKARGKYPSFALYFCAIQEVIWHQLSNDSLSGPITVKDPPYGIGADTTGWPTDELSISETRQGYGDNSAAILAFATTINDKVNAAAGWTMDKENAVRIRLYTHNQMNRYQSLITGDVPKPVRPKKVDENNQRLENISFSLYDQAGNKLFDWTSQNQDQEIYLREGHYILRENAAKQGYEKLPDIPFEVVRAEKWHWQEKTIGSRKSNVKWVDELRYLLSVQGRDIPYSQDGQTPLVTYDLMDLTLKNVPDNTCELQFVKWNKDKKPIDGAIFHLVSENKNGNQPIYDQSKSSTNGIFRFTGLTEGNYTLSETKAPDGYEKTTTTWTIRVHKKQENDPNSDLVAEFTPTLPDTFTVTDSQQVLPAIPNTALETSLTFRKVDEGKTDKGLIGGKFELTQISGGDYAHEATASDGFNPQARPNLNPKPGETPNPDPAKMGFFTFDHLTVGEYVLREKSAPNSYVKTSDYWTILVQDDGKGGLSKTIYRHYQDAQGTWQREPVAESTIGTQIAYLLKNTPEKTSISFEKLDENGNPLNLQDVLVGENNKPVEFLIYETNYYGNILLDAQGNPVFKQTITPNAQGKFELNDLTVGSYYSLVEMNPPKGYKKSDAVWTIKVIEDAGTGEIRAIINHPHNDLVSDNKNQIKGIKNYPGNVEKGKIKVRKVGEAIAHNKEIVGLRRAHIRLYELDTNLNRKKDSNNREIYQERLTSDRLDPGQNPDVSDPDEYHKNELDPKLGYATFDNLEPGDYELVEHMSPAGYTKSPNRWLVHVAKNGDTTYRLWKIPQGGKEGAPLEVVTSGNGEVTLTKPAQYSDDYVTFDVTNASVTAAGQPTESYNVTIQLTGKNLGTSSQPMPPTTTTQIVLTVDRSQDFSTQKILDQRINTFLAQLKQKAQDNGAKVEVAVVRYGLNGQTGDARRKYWFTDLDFINIDKQQSKLTFKDITTITSLDDWKNSVAGYDRIATGNTWGQSVKGTDRLDGSVGNFPYTADRKILVNFATGLIPVQSTSNEIINGKKPYGFDGGIARLRRWQGVDCWTLYTPYEKVPKNDVQKYSQVSPLYHDSGHFLNVGYKSGGFDDAQAIDTFLNKIVARIPEKIVQQTTTPSIVNGKVTIDVPNGFSLDSAYKPATMPGTITTTTLGPQGQVVVEIPKLGQNQKTFFTLSLKKDPKKSVVIPEELNVPLYHLTFEPDASGLKIYPGVVSFFQKNKTTTQTPDPNSYLQIFDTPETYSRIPLRITKVDDEGRALSRAVFRLEKIKKSPEGLGLESYDAVSSATGLPGDYYFRELTPGIYKLTEKEVPEGYMSPKTAQGTDYAWYLKVTTYIDPKDNQVKLRIVLPGDPEENDPINKDLKDYNDAVQTPVKYMVRIPDDGRSKPARPDAPYKGIDEGRISNYKSKTTLQFQKRDEKAFSTLAGATFTLTSDAKDPNDATKPLYQATVTSTAEGLLFDNLPEGTYTLKETKPPEGYQITTGKLGEWKVKVEKNAQGKLEASFLRTGSDPFMVIGGTGGGTGQAGQGGQVILTNTVAKTELSFKKLRAGTNAELYGTSFLLESIDNDGKVTDAYRKSITGSTSGIFRFTDLGEGRYRLSETARPAGFVQAGPWLFKITKNAQGQLNAPIWEGQNAPYPDITQAPTGDADHVAYYLTNYPYGKLVLSKQDMNGHALYGANFSLKKTADANGTIEYDANNNPMAGFEARAYYRLITGVKTFFTFDSLSPGTYVLKEVKAADGVDALVRDEWTFKVAIENGTIVVKFEETETDQQKKDFAPIPVADGSFAIKNKVTSTQFGFTKIKGDTPGSTVEMLKGAEFSLTRYSDDPNNGGVRQEATYHQVLGTVDANHEPISSFGFEGLKPGWYLLEETKAPDGYSNKDAQGNLLKWRVKVDDDLTITYPDLVQSTPNPYLTFSGSDGVSGVLRIKNYPKALFLKLRKKDGENNLINTGSLTLSLVKADGNTHEVPDNLKTILFDLSTQSTNPLSIALAPSMEGDYILTETMAPQGYIKGNVQYTIHIDRTKAEVTLVGYTEGGKAAPYQGQNVSPATPLMLYHYGQNDSPTAVELVLINRKPKYPDSGGMGTRRFVISGLALSLTALVGLAYRRRKRKREGGLLC